MVSGSVSLPSSGFFSPFPHGTGSLSVSWEYLALPDGPGGFAQDSSCPALLRIPLHRVGLRAGGCHPLRPNFPERHARPLRMIPRSYNPNKQARWFGLFPFRSPLLREAVFLSLPAGTKMFQFPRLAPSEITDGGCPSDSRVVPFGNPGIRGHLHLPRAYRRLSRPSSPP